MSFAEIKQHLPDKKYYEYIYHKFFNPHVKYEKWSPWDEWDYPEGDLLRFDRIIVQNAEYIKGQKVFDVACHLGYLSLFCLFNGAVKVTGSNIREKELELSKELCTVAGYLPSQFNFVNLNLYDYDGMLAQMDQHDTLLLSGILYHINNHYQFFELASKSKIKNIIIETEVTGDKDLSLVKWAYEESEHSVNGYYNNLTKIYVGVPSLTFILEMLQYFNWDIKSAIEFPFTNPTTKPRTGTNKLHQRAVIVATRN
jgi:hypothetical protein